MTLDSGVVLERLLVERIASDRLALPAMPGVVAEALLLLDRPDSDHRRLVELLEQDPLIGAQLLRIANSAAYTSGAPARTLLAAVRRLGQAALRRLLVDAAARRLYSSRDPRIAQAMHRLFHHALAVGLLTRELMLLAGERSRADEGYLAGLLHEIGKPVLAVALLEREAAATLGSWMDSKTWTALVAGSHRPVGLALAERWNLSSEIRATIAAEDYLPADAQAPLNFVLLADAITSREGIDLVVRDPTEISAVVMLGSMLLGIDAASLHAASTDLSSRAASAAL